MLKSLFNKSFGKKSPRLDKVRKAAIETLERRVMLSATFGANIVQENLLKGAPDTTWDVSGVGDTTIQGFATSMSVNVGQSISFKIADTKLAPYRIDIYRFGYYGGDGARLVDSIASTQTLDQVQPKPFTDPNTGLIDCGNWAVSASWAVPANAISGVYMARVTRTDTGGASQILFVVRNDASHSDILMKTSDATWEAYNAYGGNSLYQGTSNIASGRAVEVSYNRPFNDRATSGGMGDANYFFYAELPMVEFLEKNGFDVSYFTDSDTDLRGSEILQHKIFMAVGHDEYWSGNERANVTAARDAGVNLAFFSGNAIFWKTRFAPSTVNTDGTDTSDRILVCYKDTHANAVIDPQGATSWTGSWEDPRFSPPADGGQPQNALTGTLFEVNRGQDDLGSAFTVPASDASLRFWRNTAVSSLQTGQSLTVGADADPVGYEWDPDVDNGFRPAGEFDLSSTSFSVTQLFVDYGNTVEPGVATYSPTEYRASSGALVFSAGTVQWSWGLSGDHDDVTTTPDPVMQQATVNLFADMHVQPATLQSGLVIGTASTDAAPPVSTITSPLNGATVVSGTPVTITGTAADAGGGVVAGIEVSTDGGLTWHPASGHATWTYTWTPGATGTIHILSRAADDSGNIETPSAGINVTAQPPTAPLSVWASSSAPATVDDGDAASIEVGFRFTSDINGFITGVKFYKAAANTGVHIGNLWTANGTLLATANFVGETGSGWQLVSFTQPVAITAGTVYIASYHTNVGHYSATIGAFSGNPVSNGPLHGLEDTATHRNGVFAYGTTQFPGNASPVSASYGVDVVFSTSPVSTAPPLVTGETPAPSSTNISANTTVTATFNASIDPTTLVFKLTDSGGNVVPATVVYSGASLAATLTPTSPLSSTATYTASVTASNISGISMTAPIVWSFTTSAPGTQSYSFWTNATVPASTAVNDTASVELGMKFQSDNSGFIDGIRFYKGSGNTGTHIVNLWTVDGQLIASAISSNETATGWQQANFATPIAIAANTIYIASYFAPLGHYAADGAYFGANGANSGPIHAPADGIVGGNGVFSYGNVSSFPHNSYNATNYWVDVQFSNNPIDSVPPTVISQTPASATTNVGVTSPVTVTFSESIKSATLTTKLADPNGNVVSATVSYDDTNHRATITPKSQLAFNTKYTVTISNATDQAGNAMAPVSWSFTTASVLTFSLWNSAQIPSVQSANDGASIELGVKFSSSVNGFVSGITFFKGSANTGTHVGSLWSSSGQLLASATFANETAAGWQTVFFTTPVAATAGTQYVVSYHAPAGGYADDGGYFNTTGVTAGPLQAPAGTNGVFAYSTSSAFPSQSYNGSNYWVDVIFTKSSSDTTPPAVTAKTPAAGAVGISPNGTVTVSFTESIQPSTLLFTLTDSHGVAVPAIVTYSDATHTATLTPSAPLTAQVTYSASVSGAQDLAANVMVGSVNWSFTTAQVWEQSLVSDFNAGTGNNTQVTNDGSGEIGLAQGLDDFNSGALAANWKVMSWFSEGGGGGGGATNVTLDNSILSIGGAQIIDSVGSVNTPVDAKLAFAGVPYQHFGLAATDLDAVAGNYWAMFSSGGTSDTLFARVNINGATQDVSLGALPSGFHDYRVQPVSGGFAFYVDGALKTTLNAALPSGTVMKAVFSDYQSGIPLRVDSASYGAYASIGAFQSSIFAAGKTATWGAINWSASVPAGTSVKVMVRSGNTAAPDGSWSAWTTATNGSTVPAPAGQFLQYEVIFSTNDPTLSPLLTDITVTWS